ncbi:MAG: helix-turn-helix domain-containing protein [Firmicutes bacterium]|nr:helix-turn-helix domain-containing protein [Bacillota bacterium]
MDLGKKIIELRKSKHLSQEEFARKLNVPLVALFIQVIINIK